jgi:2-oxoglutarate dehydrogenase E2 component (dihydrolipoamide succinyltransferase)
MPLNKLVLPAMGEGITDASIIRWLVNEGDKVSFDQPLVEIATDKVDSEIPSPYDGVLKKIIAHVGEIPKVGEVIALIQSGDDVDIQTEELGIIALTHKKGLQKTTKKSITSESVIENFEKAPFVPPFVRLSALKLNIELGSLIEFSQKRQGEIITKSDLEYYVKNREFNLESAKKNEFTQPAPDVLKINDGQTAKIIVDGNTEKIPLSRIRKKIAENMLASSRNIPHVTSFIEADVTNIVTWRESNKDKFFKAYSTKLTLTPIFIETIVAAIKKYPQINVSTDGETLFLKKEIHIGMATVLPDGNLIVPVVRSADKLNIQGIALQVNDLAERARNFELKPVETTGSTFTFTNIGAFGTLTGTPLVNMPEAAILSIGAVNKKPHAILSPDGYVIGLRDIIMFSLAYDHRIIDGGLAGLFLKALKEAIERFDLKRDV